MRVAFFDFDDTLLNGDSNELWFAHLLAGGLIKADIAGQHAGFLHDYRQGKLDFTALQQLRQRVDDALPPELLKAHRHAFAVSRLLPALSPVMKERVRRHHQRGDHVAIVSATRRCLIEEAAFTLGIASLITAEPDQLVQDTPCFGAGKVLHVKAWLERMGLSLESLAESWFYTDSHNDLPLLLKVDRPVAVTPDPALRRHAEQHGWEIIAHREASFEAQY